MYCPQCGTQLPDTASFCGNCGTPVAQPVVQAAAQAAPTEEPAQQVAAEQTQPAFQPTTPTVAENLQPPAAPADQTYNPYGGYTAAPAPAAKKKVPVPLIVGIVVAAIIAIVVLVNVVSCATGLVSGGCSSADALASKLTTSTQTYLDSDLSTSAAEKYATSLVELLPKGVVDALNKGGYTESEIQELLVDDTYMESIATEYDSLKDYISITVSFETGSALDSSDISYINSEFSDMGLTDTATKGYELDTEVTLTLTADYLGYEKGYTESEVDSTSLYAIEIDGKWYLWL